jgi:hypothetical protein
MTEDHECTWHSGSIVIVDDEPRIITNCDICGKELIEDFDMNRKKYCSTDKHKERMKEYAKHQRPL